MKKILISLVTMMMFLGVSMLAVNCTDDDDDDDDDIVGDDDTTDDDDDVTCSDVSDGVCPEGCTDADDADCEPACVVTFPDAVTDVAEIDAICADNDLTGAAYADCDAAVDTDGVSCALELCSLCSVEWQAGSSDDASMVADFNCMLTDGGCSGTDGCVDDANFSNTDYAACAAAN